MLPDLYIVSPPSVLATVCVELCELSCLYSRKVYSPDLTSTGKSVTPLYASHALA